MAQLWGFGTIKAKIKFQIAVKTLVYPLQFLLTLYYYKTNRLWIRGVDLKAATGGETKLAMANLG